MRKCRKILYLIVVLMAAMSLVSLLMADSTITAGHEMEAGGALFTLPAIIPIKYNTKSNQTVSSCVYGDMDERGLCYYSYFAIFWSKQDLPDSVLLPAPAYSVKEKSSVSIKLNNGQEALHISHKLYAVKPCGREVREDLQAVKFYDARTKQYFIIAGFIKSFFPQAQLLSVASSIRPSLSGKRGQ